MRTRLTSDSHRARNLTAIAAQRGNVPQIVGDADSAVGRALAGARKALPCGAFRHPLPGSKYKKSQRDSHVVVAAELIRVNQP